MVTVSLCMIVKNEENVLARCLDSVSDLVDEIIIVDTGSTDNTKAIASRYTEKVMDFPWRNDFSAARNFSFQHATMDYIFWMDADDVLLEKDRHQFRHLKHTLDPSVDSVTMIYNLSTDENGNVTASLRRNRLVKRANVFQWYGAVHEYLEVWGTIINSDIAITHQPLHPHRHSKRNLHIYEERLAQNETFSPRDLFYFANELFDHQQYERAIEYYEKFLKTNKGWIEDNIYACGKLADCFYEIGNKEKAFHYALQSFSYDTPRAEFCCRLGYYFLQCQQYQSAVFWYKLATQLEKPKENWGLINHICWTWLPHLQLCVCYYHLGEYELAYKHNEIARQYAPENGSILHNKSLLESILSFH
ncbi:tetratricopeptide repeat-containing glycosyltransferase family 2 protein [Anoxybacteroides amylolyticum]|uniref:Tetratricopeptide repeat family protein n=1 Tax=Anoxybacteroides amylolyticum TaxID=294699 RepID=A0A160F637_9BACL|nr:glycosyltransferase [Anoxybacillus amylolyticus]ANB62059.1 tetratricopeptide repeat family protein [Anoxybacillus amylolyticus]